MSNFVTVDRKTAYLFPPSMSDWLPENHLARFVVEVVDQLDLSNSPANTPAVAQRLTVQRFF